MSILRTVTPGEIPELLGLPVDQETLEGAATILATVRRGGATAVRQYAEKFDGLAKGAPLLIERAELGRVFEGLPVADQELLQRVAGRIRDFAQAQRDALANITMEIPGGLAGHVVVPVEVAGCYAPGGGFPLPSSVLMTAIPARVAGVERVVVASPRPTEITLAAAFVADADAVAPIGGAHAIAAMAFGAEPIPRCDAIVGPGNRWVTAAKKLIFGHAAIDMLAGPSELVVLADHNASAAVIAADLLAQAEHGYDSLPVLVTTSVSLIEATNRELERQLADLPTAETARASLGKGYAVLVKNMNEGVVVVNELAPEHLELLVGDAGALQPSLRHYGALFLGEGSAEVLGDYGAGPNHTLPTGGTARFSGGLSVFNFLRIRTWMRIDDLSEAQPLVRDARDLARHERLEGHARSAEARLRGTK